MTIYIFAWLMIAFPSQGPVAAEEQPLAQGATAEEAIRKSIAAYHEALEHGDLDFVAKCWTTDGDYVDQRGHAFKIQAAFAAAKKRAEKDGGIAPPPFKTQTLAVRGISPDVALEDGIVERPAPGSAEPTKGRYCAVWVKRDGKWLIDGVRESSYSPVNSSNHFEGLDWLVGQWTADSPQGSAEASYSWGPDKKYLLGQIKLSLKGEKPITATQWIGWDPADECIRAFEYDSTGGFRNSTWTKDGDAWVAAGSAVSGDGRRSTTTNIFTRADENSVIWELLDESADGKATRDLRWKATRKRK